MTAEPQKRDVVVYIDNKGAEHTALVSAINAMHPHHLSLVYIDPVANDRENIKQVFDVPHMSDPSRQESNPELPTFHLNSWKYGWEGHNVAASDHPMHDHKFAPKPVDEYGRTVEKERPEYDAQVRDHQQYAASSEGEPEPAANAPSAADLDATAADQAAADATAGPDPTAN